MVKKAGIIPAVPSILSDLVVLSSLVEAAVALPGLLQQSVTCGSSTGVQGSAFGMGHLPVDWAYGLLYASLLGFVALVTLYEVYSCRGTRGRLKETLLHPSEDLLASGADHGWMSLGLSLFASFAGNWLLFLPADVGALYSWPGVGGYALAVSVPYLLLMLLTPTVKRLTGDPGFSGTDYLLIRYGRVVQVVFIVASVGCMFLSFTVELTTLGTTFHAVTGGKFPPPHAVVPLALGTLLYTLYGGLRTSILTDTYQGCLIWLLALPVVITVLTKAASDASSWWSLADAPRPPGGCFVAGIVLILSLWPVFLLDQGIWQRLWAAKTRRDLNIALMLAAVLAFGSVFLFGVSGMACGRAAAAYGQTTGNFSVFAFLADTLSPPWLGLITVLAVACVASSVDTYQIALASVFVHDLKSANRSYNWARLMLVVGNAAAIALACAQLPLLTLCMASNMVCVAVSGPLLGSLVPHTTTIGLICGVVAGFCTAFICGLCFTGDFVEALKFFAPADFSSAAYLVAFSLMPLAGFVVSVSVSKIYRMLQPASQSGSVTRIPPGAAQSTPAQAVEQHGKLPDPAATKQVPSALANVVKGITETSEQGRGSSDSQGEGKNGCAQFSS